MRPITPHEDAWPFLAKHTQPALREAMALLTDPSLPALMEERYRAGERLHKRTWLRWPLSRFRSEAREEAADLVNYLMMERVKRSQEEAP